MYSGRRYFPAAFSCRLESITMSGRFIDRVVVVLVRARNPNNIGAVARAMHDFGFRHLRVVNEYAVPFETARSAVDAADVVAGATTFDSVADAVADCTLVVGTTAVGERELQHPLYALAEAGEKVDEELALLPVGRDFSQGCQICLRIAVLQELLHADRRQDRHDCGACLVSR